MNKHSCVNVFYVVLKKKDLKLVLFLKEWVSIDN